VSAIEPTAHCRAGYRRQGCRCQNWYWNSRARFPWTIKFPDAAGKLFSLPAQIYGKYFLFMESTALPRQSLQCPGPIVPSLYSVRVSVSSLVWLGDK
jgi:hypothetical protein